MPLVVSSNPKAYERTSDDLLNAIPESVFVKRAFALDTARHLSVRGRYFTWMAIPDRWVTWILGAVPTGYLMMRKYRPEIIWSTYPIASAHVIAWILHKLTGVPWIADFRDPMVEEDPRTGELVPHNKLIRNVRLWIESLCVRYASRVIFCTNGAMQICKERYPSISYDHLMVIPNGYDESDFEAISIDDALEDQPNKPLILLHSGIIYPTTDRDPSGLFDALVLLRQKNKISPSILRIILRATGHDEYIRAMIRERHIEDMVFIEPAIPYHSALSEMCKVDGLLVLQGYTSNPAIPAKVYEYLRAGKPIVALVDPEGDTSVLLNSIGINYQAPLDDTELIITALKEFIANATNKSKSNTTKYDTQMYTRAEGARILAGVLNVISKREKMNK